MSRNLKALLLALVAVYAMSAMVASAAAQQGKLTSDGSVKLLGTNEGKIGDTLNFFEYPGLGKVECEAGSYVGEKIGGGLLPIPSTSATTTLLGLGGTCLVNGTLKMTTLTNGCDSVASSGGTTAGVDEYGVQADIICPAGKVAEMLVYASQTSEAVQLCRLVIGPQVGITGLDIANEVDGAGNTTGTLTLTGESKNIKVTKSGSCGAGETKEARTKATVTITGQNSVGASTAVSITD